MTTLTHAVYDTTNGGDQVGPGHPDAATAFAAASALGGAAMGYVVDLVRWKPPKTPTLISLATKNDISISDMLDRHQPEPAPDPKPATAEPGLFD
jgi:hypothetical protein